MSSGPVNSDTDASRARVSVFPALVKLIRLYRSMLGRRVYLLFLLLPLSTLAEGLGFTLLLPLLSRLDGSESTSQRSGGVLARTLESLPLPTGPMSLLGIIAFFFVLKAALKFGTEALRAVMQARVVTMLKANMVTAYTNLSYRAFAEKNTGHYVNIVTNQTSRMGQALQLFTQTVTQCISATVFLVIAALVNWQFALVAGAAGVVFALVTMGLTRFVARLSRKTVAEQTNLNTQLVQILHSLKYLMATSRSDNLIRRVRGVCDRLYQFRANTGIAHGFLASVKEPLSVILILGLVAIQIAVFKQPLANIFVALLLLDRATKALFGVQGTWQKTMEVVGAVESVHRELRFVQDAREPRGEVVADKFHDRIEFKSVSFAYEQEDGDVLREVCLQIPHNQTVALVGSSGAGKSTIADLLTILLQPTDGELLIDGNRSGDLDPTSWRKQLGYVCQETVVFDETVAANICLHESLYETDESVRDRVHDAARQAFASEFIEAMPDGFNTLVGDRGVRLSGGQRQRLFIARELYKQPAVLLLDEATSALDADSEKAIQDGIDALHGRVTVVVIAHRLATIKNADYIYVLEAGAVVEEGSYEQLTANSETRFSRMVQLQSL